MDPERKALGTLLASPLSKTGCDIWKEETEDRVGAEASSEYLTPYPFNCFGSTALGGPTNLPRQTEQLAYGNFPPCRALFPDGVGGDIRKKASHPDLRRTWTGNPQRTGSAKLNPARQLLQQTESIFQG